MKPIDYGDNNKVRFTELLLSIPAWTIGGAILSLPRYVAKATQSSDGWISILFAGLITILFCWITIKLAYQFPNQSFLDYAKKIIFKPLAYIVTFSFALNFLLWVSYETRIVAEASLSYMFERTPMEVIALVFLLVVIYAVSGSREGLFRLNILFQPIVIIVSLTVIVLNLPIIKIENLRPVFVSDWKNIVLGMKESAFSFVGFEFLLFYIPFLNQTKKGFKLAVLGMSIPIALYISLYIVTIGALGVEVTKEVLDPGVELTKMIEVPGEFFERFESLFFAIWIMAIFNTASIAFDICLIALQSIFPRFEKMKCIYALSPLIFLIAMLPRDRIELTQFTSLLTYTGLVTGCLPVVLFIISKIKRGYGV